MNCCEGSSKERKQNLIDMRLAKLNKLFEYEQHLNTNMEIESFEDIQGYFDEILNLYEQYRQTFMHLEYEGFEFEEVQELFED